MMMSGSRRAGIAVAGALLLATAGFVSTAAAQDAAKAREELAALDAKVDAFWQATPLFFRTALFVDEAKAYGDYTPRTGTSFKAGDAIRVYAEPVGYGYASDPAGYKIALKAGIEIRNKGGQILARAAEPVSLEQTSRAKSREFHITVGIDLPALKAGDYTLAIPVTDLDTEKTALIELPFTIAP